MLSRRSAKLIVASLSEPMLLIPIVPPLRSAAVLMPGAANKVKRMTLLREATIYSRAPAL